MFMLADVITKTYVGGLTFTLVLWLVLSLTIVRLVARLSVQPRDKAILAIVAFIPILQIIVLILSFIITRQQSEK